jgi:hypothetical protein
MRRHAAEQLQVGGVALSFFMLWGLRVGLHDVSTLSLI